MVRGKWLDSPQAAEKDAFPGVYIIFYPSLRCMVNRIVLRNNPFDHTNSRRTWLTVSVAAPRTKPLHGSPFTT
jgi:hypothetical protein